MIREEKIPEDNRVAFTPSQCKSIKEKNGYSIVVQHSAHRCYKDAEYIAQGIEVKEDLSDCDILFGIKEVPRELLMPGKTYFFFSHTKKLQPYNRALFQTICQKKITLVDYECLEHEDGTRLLGFGFFAGVVGAHNGMMAYGNRTKEIYLERVYKQKNFKELIHSYFGLKIPPVKIAVAGSGRVAHGITEVMNLMEIHEVEPDEYKETKEFAYPVYVHLKGKDLYINKESQKYDRKEFHEFPERYRCLFSDYLFETDILMNGVYWQQEIPRLFEMDDLKDPNYRMHTIADISDDENGSVPCNLGDATIEVPVYGVNRMTGKISAPYLADSVDVMAVGNLPNELPRDASRFFGEQLIKYIVNDLETGSPIIAAATMTKKGELTDPYQFMKEYASIVDGVIASGNSHLVDG